MPARLTTTASPRDYIRVARALVAWRTGDVEAYAAVQDEVLDSPDPSAAPGWFTALVDSYSRTLDQSQDDDRILDEIRTSIMELTLIAEERGESAS